MGDHRGGIARRGLAVADLAFSIDGGRGSDSREILDPLVKTRVFGMTPSMRLVRVSGIISPFAAVRVAGLA